MKKGILLAFSLWSTSVLADISGVEITSLEVREIPAESRIIASLEIDESALVAHPVVEGETCLLESYAPPVVEIARMAYVEGFLVDIEYVYTGDDICRVTVLSLADKIQP
ncbi:MAG: hypothetical protein OXE99_02775 [Cellvibrionales bacterium]|nr:hypothetical protein [Cellvibrionales bacterium]